jgi:DNA-binding NarL/FixJ family response regulator
MNPIRILVTSDCDAVRTGISTLLEQCPLFKVVAQASSGAEGVGQALRRYPDIVVLDISIQDMSCADVCSQILHHLPETRVILLSNFSDDKRLTAALGAGAAGYVLKRIGIDNLIEMITSLS